jgi:hypothetical protein
MSQRDLRSEQSLPQPETDLQQAKAPSQPRLDNGEAVAAFRGIREAVHREFGKRVVALAQPLLREAVFEQGRDALSPAEVRALAALPKFDALLERLAGEGARAIKPIGGSADLLLRDILVCLCQRERGVHSNPIIVSATACPDYQTDGHGHYVAAGGLHAGVGLSAEKIVEALTPLLHGISRENVPVLLELCYADIEAFDPVTLEKSGLSQPEFLAMVKESCNNAQAIFAGAFHAVGLDCGLRVRAMSEFMPRNDPEGLLEGLRTRGIRNDEVLGIANHRYGFYARFFESQMRRAGDSMEFAVARAARDIDDHVRLNHVLGSRRSEGELVNVATMSIPALAKYLRHNNPELPAFAVQQDY